MTLRLRFAFEVEFDSPETAKAFGAALGWSLGTVVNNTLALSEAPEPHCERGPFEVVQVKADHHG